MQWLILVKHDNTGGAWWVLDPLDAVITFKNNPQYKIEGEIFTEDSHEFRKAWHLAIWKYIS